jgi:hypothetical protein
VGFRQVGPPAPPAHLPPPAPTCLPAYLPTCLFRELEIAASVL